MVISFICRAIDEQSARVNNLWLFEVKDQNGGEKLERRMPEALQQVDKINLRLQTDNVFRLGNNVIIAEVLQLFGPHRKSRRPSKPAIPVHGTGSHRAFGRKIIRKIDAAYPPGSNRASNLDKKIMI